MDNQNDVKLGKCQLSSQSNLFIISHISPSLLRTIQSEQWRLGDREFRDVAAIQIFQNARIVEAVTIWLDFNKKPTIITDILQPKYTHLRTIYLGDNNITSIQLLQALDAPLLERLFLNHNRIANIKSLRKCIFPKLLELNLNGNVITDENWLIQAHFPLLDKLSLGYKRNNQKIDQSAWFLKAQIKNQTQILSPQHKLHTFNRIVFYNSVRDNLSRRTQPKDLFKTFQN